MVAALDELTEVFQATGNVLAIVSDGDEADGDTTTASFTIDENQTDVTTVRAQAPGDATVLFSISGGADAALFEIDPDTGVLTLVNPLDFENALDAYEVIVQALSDTGETDTQTLVVTVADVNDAPVVSKGIEDQASDAAAVWSFELPEGTFSDIDGDVPTYTATLADGTALPKWLSFDAATSTSTFSDTPPRGLAGPLVLRVTASDGSLFADATFTLEITPANDAPTFTGSPELASGAVGSLAAAYSQDLSTLFTDANGDALTFTAADLPAGFALGSAGVLTLVDLCDLDLVGDTVITVTADDGLGGTITQDVAITVVLENDFGRASVEVVDGSSISDTITVGYLAGSDGGSASVDGGDGADTITFGRYAGYVGSITVDGGDDADMITFENFAGYEGGSVSVDGGEGADTITFGELAGTLRGSVTVDGGGDGDLITFGNDAGFRGGAVTVNGGDGALSLWTVVKAQTRSRLVRR